MQETAYIGIIIVLGALFFVFVVGALYWSAKNGQWRDFDSAARSIFTDDEPEGVQTDFFPEDKKAQLKKHQSTH